MRRLLIISVVISVLATACGSGGSSVLSASSWCDSAKKIEETSNTMDNADMPTADLFRTFSKQLDDSKGSAPAEIRDDVKLLAETMDSMVKALAENDDNILLAFDSVGSAFNNPGLDSASNRITAYNERECGIVDTNASDSGSSTSNSDSSSPGSSGFDSPNDTSGFDLGGDSGVPVDGIIAGLADSLGMTEDQARCLVQKFDFTSNAEPDLATMMSSFADCGIDPLTLGAGG